MCCDFLIASERARFADTHARVGVMPGGGMTIRLPQLIGIDRARRMSFTGDFIDAETARDWGLVVEVVPHDTLVARAQEIAATIAAIPADYVREVRRRYDEIERPGGPGGVASPSPSGRGSGWTSASTSPAWPPSARRSSPGAGSRARGSAARRREGLRGHGPAPRPARRASPMPGGWSGSATTACTWPRRCTTRWRWRCWWPSTPSASRSAPAWPWPSPAARRWWPTRPGTSPS